MESKMTPEQMLQRLNENSQDMSQEDRLELADAYLDLLQKMLLCLVEGDTDTGYYHLMEVGGFDFWPHRHEYETEQN